MAFQRNAGFTSAIATDPAATAAGYLTPTRYNLPFVVSGADVGGIPYCPTATTEATSARLVFDSATNRVTIGTADNSTTTGVTLGNIATGSAGIWNAGIGSYGFKHDAVGNSFLNASAGASVFFQINGSNKVSVNPTAGDGMSIIAGTATTDVAALSVTRTNNNAAVATGVKFAFTDTTSAAGFLPFQILGGAAGATNLLSVGKAGLLTLGGDLVLANAYVGTPQVATGYIIIKDSTGTSYKVSCNV